MPEAPELEVVKEFLNAHVAGRSVTRAMVLRPVVLCSLVEDDFADDVVGRVFGRTERRGKVLLLPLEPERMLVVQPMLTGVLQYCAPEVTVAKRTFFILGMEEMDLRYMDERQIGIVYYVRPDQMGRVPRLERQALDALDPSLTYEEFVRRLGPFRGEIKGILTRGEFIGGIGNAYVDEILFAAGVSPFRRRKELTDDDLHRLHQAVPDVLNEAIGILRERMPPDIHIKVRDFLKVHRKGGQLCPRCGHTISEITANQRITSYCRRCQPGMLIRN